MSHRQRVDEEGHPVRALQAAAEANEAAERARSTRSVLAASGRAREAGRGGDASVARAIGGLQAGAGNAAVSRLLQGSATVSHATGTPHVRAGISEVAAEPVVQGFWGDDEEEASAPSTDVAGGPDPAAAGQTGAVGAGGDDGQAMPEGGETAGVTNVGGETAGGDGAGATPLGGGAPAANPSWTKVGPPTNTTYAVSGSLRTVATAIAARPEAGSVKVTPGRTLQSWTPDGGTETVLSAQVQVDQEVELPTWSDKSNATKNQQAEWDRFHTAITTHEAGHVGKDKTAFAGVHSKMLKKTEADADKTLDTAEAQAKTDNAAYDTSTNSGLSQGTGINANIDEVTKVP